MHTEVANVGRVDMSGVVGRDVDALYELAGVVDVAWTRVCARGLPPQPAFEDVLFKDVHAIHKLTMGEALVGACALYDVKPTAQNGWIELVLAPGLDEPEVGGPLLEALARDFHERFELRKLTYAHLSSGPSMLANTSLDWVEEGRLRRRVVVDGFAWDLVLDAIWFRAN